MARLYSDPTQNPVLAAALRAADQNGAIVTPPQQDFNTPAMDGSMQQFLSENLGQYVVIEFLVGTQNAVAKAGVLYAVGTSVVTLYEEVSQTFVTCDIFSVKFVTFFLPGHRPWQANHPLFPTNGMNGVAAKPVDVATITPGTCIGGNCGGYPGGMA